MTQKAAAEILRLPTSTLSNLLQSSHHAGAPRAHHPRPDHARGRRDLLLQGRTFATLVYDLDRAQVVWVGQGKGRDTIDRFFNDWMSRGQKARVAWASCDMSPAYIGAITHHCPNVPLVIDRFHLVKALNQAVDEVRKEQWRALDTQGRKAIKGLRWLLSRHSRHRTKGHTRFLNSLRNSNRRIHRAWVLKDEFEHFWDYRYPASAKKFLRRWMTAALRSRIPTICTFVGTLRTHLVHIMAFIDRPLTNESPDIKVGRSQRTGSTCAVSPAHLSSSNNHRLNTLRRLLAAAEQAPQPERGLRRRPSTEARKYCSGRSQKNP